jgi:glycosyltransferase involved in cell wall biosynthesis
MKGEWRPDNWFKISPMVKDHLIPTPMAIFMPRADVYVAGWWSTAERLAALRSLPGRRLYLIQHLETWAGPEEEVMATWRMPLEKIVIARWLQKIAEDLGESSCYIPNGLDLTRFGCDIAPESRSTCHLAMMYNDRVDWKGSPDGVAALELLKARFPEVEADVFGVHERPETLPAWITYWQQPSQQDLRGIYNRASIFLAPSHSEGWGLPPCEAMACGAAVVATDIGGHREFCIDGKTALLVPMQNPKAMAAAAATLIENDDLRIRIARYSCEHIQKFTWEDAVDAFEQLLHTPGFPGQLAQPEQLVAATFTKP